MDIIWARVSTYRRFAETQNLKLGGKLIALVGPNEAGKTSLLDALYHLGHDEPFDRLDKTRRIDSQLSVRVEGAFFLDHGDRESIGDVPGATKVKWIHATLTAAEAHPTTQVFAS